ncbi:MAG: hypothetical protein IPL25_03010 [Saprospiraceae bacterium]|nr:hypothetical protein [Candidatus Vicinibacter affinis]
MDIRKYLNRLEGLKQYEDVQIEWKYIQVIEDVKQKEDGSYYGRLRVYQIFEGLGKDGKPMYKDITEKDIEVKLKDSGRAYFDLKFGDITVFRLLDDSDRKKP